MFLTFGLGNGRFFGGGGLLEGRRFFFEEIRYSTTRIPHSHASIKFNQDLDRSQNISEREDLITKSRRYCIIFVKLADLAPPKLTNGNYDGKNHFFDMS